MLCFVACWPLMCQYCKSTGPPPSSLYQPPPLMAKGIFTSIVRQPNKEGEWQGLTSVLSCIRCACIFPATQ